MKLEMFKVLTKEELKKKIIAIAEEGMTWKLDSLGIPYTVDGTICIELSKKATIEDRNLVNDIKFICDFNKITCKFSIEE